MNCYKALVLLLFLFSTSIHSQKFSKPNKDFTKSEIVKIQKSNMQYSYCDNDFDGQVAIDFSRIKEVVLDQYSNQLSTEKGVYISTKNGRVLFVSDLDVNPAISTKCVYSTSVMNSLLDIAISQNNDYYVAIGRNVKKINKVNCQPELLYDYGFSGSITALSFDTKSNMYLGGFDTKVYQAKERSYDRVEIWHDFGQGTAAGDFVIVGDKMYVAWRINFECRLYEITLDSNNNFQSYVDLGRIPDNTFGLASELGNLYGVTVSSLYKIDKSTMQTVTVVYNPSTSDLWYGAAGQNEAVAFKINVFETENNATNNENPLPNLWFNTVSGGQTVYVSVLNTITNQSVIVPVDLIVNIPPRFIKPTPLTNCDSKVFNVRELTDNLIKDGQNNVVVHYYLNADDAQKDNNRHPDVFTLIGEYQKVFSRITNTTTGCFSVFDFELQVNQSPVLNAIPDTTVCANSPVSSSIFDLQALNPKVIQNRPASDFEIHYYLTLFDAQNELNRILMPVELNTQSNHFYVNLKNKVSKCFTTTDFFINYIEGEKVETIIQSFITKEWSNNDNSIEVVPTQNGNYEFSIDGFSFQNSPRFSHLEPGNYAITVKDLNNCNYQVKSVTILNYPDFFTPNNDGYNDVWNINFDKSRDDFKIFIYDRYGKLLKMLNGNDGWDGKYQGRDLPSSDYWFVVKKNNDNEYVKGHFSLKR